MLVTTRVQVAEIESCGAPGQVTVVMVGEAGATALRGRSQPGEEAAGAAAVDAAFEGAEVVVGAFWDTVPGSKQVRAV